MSESLLAAGDPLPFEILNPQGRAPVILTCEHAGNAFPESLGRLGLAREDIEAHWAYDPGARAVAAHLADILNAPAICGTYSRAVVDLNREIGQPSLFVTEGEGKPIPGNAALTEEDKRARLSEIYDPYHAALARMVEQGAQGDLVPALVSIHSFTPKFYNHVRPWEVGVLWVQDPRIPAPLLDFYRRQNIVAGDNEPYDARIFRGSAVNRHGDLNGLPNVLIEFRSDTIDSDAKARAAAELCAKGLRPIFSDPSLFTRYEGPQIPYDPEVARTYLEQLVEKSRKGENPDG